MLAWLSGSLCSGDVHALGIIAWVLAWGDRTLHLPAGVCMHSNRTTRRTSDDWLDGVIRWHVSDL